MVYFDEKVLVKAQEISNRVQELRKIKLEIEKEIKYRNKKMRDERVVLEIKRLIKSLNLFDLTSAILRLNAIKIYTKANADIDELKNHNIESIAAACLILACEKALVDISFSDISKHSPERGCIISGVYGLIKYHGYNNNRWFDEI